MYNANMRAVIQRVSKAEVRVEDKIVGKINFGYFVLLGITQTDNEAVAKKLAIKVSKLRIMADENEKMNLDLKMAKASCLVVSQFTLYSDTSGGNRPSFTNSANSEYAKPLYNTFVTKLVELGINVQTGEFGSYMKIETKLDGPVTIILDENV